MIKFKSLTYGFNPQILASLFLLDITGIFTFVNKYLFQDTGFLKWLIIATILDLITGVTKAWVREGYKAVTSRGLRDTVTKLISYGSFLIITHVLTHFEVNGIAETKFLWLNKVAYEFLILIEIKSVYENLILINPKLDFIQEIIGKIAGSIVKSKKNDNTTV